MKAFWLSLLIFLFVLGALWLRESDQSADTDVAVAAPEPRRTVAPDSKPPEQPTPPIVRFAEVEPEGARTPPQGTSGNEVEIQLHFPKPMYLAPPRPVARLPNLEAPGSSPPISSFFAPVGTLNIALNKPVTSSDPSPIIGDLTLVTDGDSDGSDGHFVELAPGAQWVQIDLGRSGSIFRIAVWHYHKSSRAYVDVLVQVSNDPEFRNDVVAVFNSDHDNTLGMGAGTDPTYIETNYGRVIDAQQTVGRYVRLTSNGNTSNEMNHYCEVAVYGVPED